MIPQIIHYCWFGGNPLPNSVKKCITSWKKFFPEYDIKEWNESNFDVNMMPFSREAYLAKKYAFVSDVARFYILYHEGGLYFDTDVEIVASFDDILAQGAFMGVEVLCNGVDGPAVNPGLGLGAEKGNPVLKSILEHYQTRHFCDEDGVQLPGTVVAHTTEVLKKEYGLLPINEIQKLGDITIYPIDFFNPFDDATGVLRTTKNTRSIHWYSKTWIEKPMWYFKITRLMHRMFGVNALSWIKNK